MIERQICHNSQPISVEVDDFKRSLLVRLGFGGDSDGSEFKLFMSICVLDIFVLFPFVFLKYFRPGVMFNWKLVYIRRL